jgi:hypothetical protein
LAQNDTYKIIYDPNNLNTTLFYSGPSTLTTFKTSPFWPDVFGPKNVTVNRGTLEFEKRKTIPGSNPAITDTAFLITNVQLTNNVATITTSQPHNYVAGNSVTIGGLNTSEFGSVFGGTFTIANTPPVTTNTFSFALTNPDVPSTPVTGGVAPTNVNRTIQGILRLDGGTLKVNAGNFLRMGGGSTIIRNTDVSKLTLTNGFLALGSSSTEKVNIEIGATMPDGNEFASFTTPGGYGTLTLNSGIRYGVGGSRKIVDLNALGTSQLSLDSIGNFTINGNILSNSTGTISGKPIANLIFGGTNAGPLSAPLKFTTGAESIGNLTIDRTGTNAQIQLGTSVNVTGNLLLSNGTFNIGSNDALVIGDIKGSGTVIGSGKIKMTGINKNITLNPSLNNIEVGSGASIGNCSANISGTLAMSGGDISIGLGNTLLMKNGSTINRNSGKIDLNSGTMSGLTAVTTTALSASTAGIVTGTFTNISSGNVYFTGGKIGRAHV